MAIEIPDDFFPPLEAPPPRDRRQPRTPIWMDPPPDEMAGLVPVRQVLARTDRVAIVLSHADAYREGVRFRFHVVARCLPDDTDDDCGDLHEHVFGHRVRRVGGRPPGPLRVGVYYADGTRVLGTHPRYEPGGRGAPEQPSLSVGGGGGGGSAEVMQMSVWAWLWPLPPAEPFLLALAWQDVDIPVVAIELDGGVILEGAGRATPMWKD